MIILQICTIVSRYVFISVGSEDCAWCGNFKTGSYRMLCNMEGIDKIFIPYLVKYVAIMY